MRKEDVVHIILGIMIGLMGFVNGIIVGYQQGLDSRMTEVRQAK